MTVLTEGQHAGEFLVSEANGDRSRDACTVLSGQTLKAGHVVGVVVTGTGTATAGGGNTGDGTMGTVTVGAGAMAGDYTLNIIEAATNAGNFELIDPQGDVAGIGTVAVAFSGGGLSFTLADGATDFAVGDTFNIAVVISTEKQKEWNPANTDGSEIVSGILFDAVDASAADTAGVLVNMDSTVNASELQYFTGADAADKALAAAQLKRLGIKVR